MKKNPLLGGDRLRAGIAEMAMKHLAC